MADNVTLPGTGAAVASDDIGGVQYQRIKIGAGGDGSYTEVSKDNPLPVNLPSSMLDSFGKVMTVNSINDIDVQFHRDVPANLLTVTTANGGTVTQATGLAQFATSTATNGAAKGVSLDNVLYRSGGEIFALVTGAWLDGGAASSYQRIGLYDTNNGIFIGYEGTTFGVTVRQNAVDSQTAKASWNVDTLTGTAGSKFTRNGSPEAINLALLNVFRIRFGWLGAAPIKFEVLSPDGEWVLFHVIRQPNSSATPHIYSTDIPITCDLVKTAGATNLRFNTACWGAGVTYDKVDIVASNTLSTGANSVVNYNTQGVGTLQVRVGTSTTGTLAFEGTTDGTNWVTHPYCFLIGSAGAQDTQVTAAFTPTSGNTYRMQCTGFRAVRARTVTTLGASVVLHAQGDAKQSMVNVVQSPSIKDLKRIAVTSGGLTTSVTNYSAGDQVGTVFTVADAARASGGSGMIVGVQIISATDNGGAYDVVFFDSAPAATAGDNVAWNLANDSDAQKIVGIVQCAAAFDTGANRIAQAFNIAIPYVCSGSANLSAALIKRDSGAFFYGATTDILLVVYVERN